MLRYSCMSTPLFLSLSKYILMVHQVLKVNKISGSLYVAQSYLSKFRLQFSTTEYTNSDICVPEWNTLEVCIYKEVTNYTVSVKYTFVMHFQCNCLAGLCWRTCEGKTLFIRSLQQLPKSYFIKYKLLREGVKLGTFSAMCQLRKGLSFKQWEQFTNFAKY